MSYRYRSAVTGQFVSARQARRRPRTTVRERIKALTKYAQMVAAARRRLTQSASATLKARLRG